jgi:hypothetical protein
MTGIPPNWVRFYLTPRPPPGSTQAVDSYFWHRRLPYNARNKEDILAHDLFFSNMMPARGGDRCALRHTPARSHEIYECLAYAATR